MYSLFTIVFFCVLVHCHLLSNCFICCFRVTVSAVLSLVGPAHKLILLLPTCKCDMFEQINLIWWFDLPWIWCFLVLVHSVLYSYSCMRKWGLRWGPYSSFGRGTCEGDVWPTEKHCRVSLCDFEGWVRGWPVSRRHDCNVSNAFFFFLSCCIVIKWSVLPRVAAF